MPAPDLDLLSRREFSRLVSLLTRRLGPDRLDVAEDAVQEAFGAAARLWSAEAQPREPAAWLYRVAWNKALDQIRRRQPSQSLEDLPADPVAPPANPADGTDAELQLILLCCHPSLTADSQVALTLKVAAGFSIPEIARLLGAAHDAVDQRLLRARRKLRVEPAPAELPPGDVSRRALVALDVIYAMFSEGYASLTATAGLRRDLCAESLRLLGVMQHNPATTSGEAHALAALCAFQASRLDSRFDHDGTFRSLRDQDRSAWDANLITLGMGHLARSQGPSVSRFHLEAEIAACHAAAGRYAETDWPRIVELYDLLVGGWRSPALILNRAIAIGERDGARAGRRALEAVAPDLTDSPLFHAACADTLQRLGDQDGARDRYRRALALATGPAVARALEARLAALSP